MNTARSGQPSPSPRHAPRLFRRPLDKRSVEIHQPGTVKQPHPRRHLLAVRIAACLQAHDPRANWHPHLHLLVTDGGFRSDETFVSWPAHDTALLTEAFGCAALRLCVPLELFPPHAR